jgi:putative sigma-54 modulation protein
MKLVITGRKMTIAPGLKKFIEERANKMEHYGAKPLQATITLKVEKYRQIAEAHVSLNGAILQAEEVTDEMEVSVDKVMSKIEKQIKKYKEKVSDHRVRAGETVLGKPKKAAKVPVQKEEDVAPFVAVGHDLFRIPKREKVVVNRLTIEDALLQMKSNKKDIFIFRNSAKRQLNLLYKKKSGILGLMELVDAT